MLISIAIAAAIIIAGAMFGQYLPAHELLGGSFYRVVTIIAAIAVTAFMNMPMINMLRGNSAYDKGRFKDALALYKKAYKSNRLSIDLSIYYGYILLKEGHISDAEKVFSAVSRKKLNERQKATLDSNSALLKWKQGDLPAAISSLSALWDSSPAAAVGGSLGALMLLDAKEHKEKLAPALDFCESADEQFTYDKTIMCNKAEALLLSGRAAEAKEVCEELIDLRPTTPSPYYVYALVLKALGEKEDAEDMLRKSLRFRFTSLSPVTRKEVESELQPLSSGEYK